MKDLIELPALCDFYAISVHVNSLSVHTNFICMVMSSIRGEIPSPCPPNLFMKNLLLYLEIFWYPSQNTEPFFQIAGKSEFSDKMLSLYFQLNFWFDWLISWKMWSISLAFFTPSLQNSSDIIFDFWLVNKFCKCKRNWVCI